MPARRAEMRGDDGAASARAERHRGEAPKEAWIAWPRRQRERSRYAADREERVAKGEEAVHENHFDHVVFVEEQRTGREHRKARWVETKTRKPKAIEATEIRSGAGASRRQVDGTAAGVDAEGPAR